MFTLLTLPDTELRRHFQESLYSVSTHFWNLSRQKKVHLNILEEARYLKSKTETSTEGTSITGYYFHQADFNDKQNRFKDKVFGESHIAYRHQQVNRESSFALQELIASKMDFTSTIAAMNTSNVTTAAPPPGEIYDPLWATTLRWIIGGIIVFVGSVGNVMVCAVVYRNQRMQTAMNLFLVNLAVWDILVCLFNIPFTLIYNHLKSWPFGLFWCKTMPTLQVMNLSASTGSLVAITVERYRAICLPFTPPLSKFQAKLIIALVSMTSFLVALPEVGAYTLGPPFGCMEMFHTPTLRKAYSLLLFLACYLIPLMFIAPAYTRMICKLWNDRDGNSPSSGVSEDPKNSKRKRNVLRMMVIVVLCYAICMMPTYAIFLWLDFGLTGNPPSYFFILLSFMQMLNFFNSCVNPIIYWCLSEQFSKGFKKILRCDKFNKSWTRQPSSSSSSEPNVQSTINPHTVPTRV